MPIVTLTAYFVSLDFYGRLWFKIPLDIRLAKDTRYKLMALERHFGGCSPVRGDMFYVLQGKKRMHLPELLKCKGSLVTIHTDFKRYFNTDSTARVGWNLTVFGLDLCGTNVKLR